MRKVVLLLIIPLCLACSQDVYEKGNGEFSSLQADFVEAHSIVDKKIDYVVTDDNQHLTLQTPYSVSWAEKADSFYRAALFFSKNDNLIEPVSISKINVAKLTLKKSLKGGMKTDPLTLESMWVSKNKSYLNLSFYLKVGSTDDTKAIHQLAVVVDTLIKHADKKQTLYVQLYHDQGGVPEYYSQHGYCSLPLKGVVADSICFMVNTYKGEVMKTLPVK